YWLITDENGYQYYFGESSASREESVDVSVSATSTDTYVSTWYLSRIMTPQGVQVATFTYTAGVDISYPIYSQRKTDKKAGSCPSDASPINITTTIKTIAPKYLTLIETSIGSASFGLANREDLAGSKSVTDITIKEGSNVIKRYYLIFSYFFDAGDPFQIAKYALRLDKVKEDFIISSKSYREFSYEGTQLGPRFSSYVDHWGYSNRPNGTSEGPGIPVYQLPNVNIGCPAPWCSGGASKDPNYMGLIRGVLNKVVYTTGGYTLFDYEAKAAGGLRVKTISTFSSSASLVDRKSYTYAGSMVFYTPVYHYLYCSQNSMIRFSGSARAIFDLGGVANGYSWVTETFLDGSRIEREFTNYDLYPDDPPTVTKYLGPIPQGPADINGPPFTSYSPKFWMRGLPKTVIVYDNLNNKLSEATTEYTSTLSSASSVRNNYPTELNVQEGTQWITIQGNYSLSSYAVQVFRSINKTFQQGQGPSPANSFQETTTYTYHATHKTVPASMTTQRGAIGPATTTTYRYPTDVATVGPPVTINIEADGMWCLKAWNIIRPVEVVTLFKESDLATPKVVGAVYNTYRRSTAFPSTLKRPLPYKSYSLKVSDPPPNSMAPLSFNSDGSALAPDPNYRLVRTYTVDDNTSLVTAVTDDSGVPQNFEWGNNNSLLTASIVSPGANQMRSEYIHKPMVGITQQKDPNGQISYYEYDQRSRLKILRDQDQNIVNRFRYHYKDESDLLPDFSYTMDRYYNTTFTSTSPVEPGMSYAWDFGNGTIKENGAAAESIMCLPNTNYAVTLALSHPEFATQLTTKSILPPVGASITGPGGASGTNRSIDICNGSNTSTSLQATVTGGPYTYLWEYRNTSSLSNPWSTIGGDSPSLNFNISGGAGVQFEVLCRITDSSGGIRYSNRVFLYYFCSTSGGGGPGGGGGEITCGADCFWNGTQCVCPPPCPPECTGRNANGVCICP
ncbi:MAG: hypothetical protein K2U26_08330, partial [Cyclobacteriaceae bacterium]|nr:hypothetical protein [Cyclobacteriaceae bacterium]